MNNSIDKRLRADLFRQRLSTAMAQVGITQSGLARAIGVERSTISQLLRDLGPRLPNAQVIAECASVLRVSADWLLGLTDLSQHVEDIMAQMTTMTDAPRALVDEQIFEWHKEAQGYKIRHVPAGLPDMLKTQNMLRWEYEPALGRTTDQAIGASEDRLNWMRQSGSDYEIALPLHDMKAFARGEGYYRDCPSDIRHAQLRRFIELHEQLYPTLRVHLFDARKLFSAPVTVFGPKVAVLYMGQKYLAFRDTARVKAVSAHFDQLIREAEIGSRKFPTVLRELLDKF